MNLKMMRMMIEVEMMDIEAKMEIEMLGVVPLFACFSSFTFLGPFDKVKLRIS